jgi:hypothetical protein
MRAALGRVLPFCAAGAIAGWLGTAAPAHAEDSEAPVLRADGLAASIGGGSGEEAEVILRSDVDLRARMSLAGQGARTASADQAALSTPPASLLEATLNELVGEALIAREAQRVQVAMPSSADIQHEKQRLVLMVGGRARLDALLQSAGADESEIDAIAKRRAITAAFLSANLEGAMVVTDGEIEQRYHAEAASFAGIEPAQARELIRARLAREALARNIERWVRVLRARTNVRIVASFKAS